MNDLKLVIEEEIIKHKKSKYNVDDDIIKFNLLYHNFYNRVYVSKNNDTTINNINKYFENKITKKSWYSSLKQPISYSDTFYRDVINKFLYYFYILKIIQLFVNLKFTS